MQKAVYITDADGTFVGSAFMISNKHCITALRNFPLHPTKKQDKITEYHEVYSTVRCIRVLDKGASASREQLEYTIESIDLTLDVCLLARKTAPTATDHSHYLSLAVENPLLASSCLVVGFSKPLPDQAGSTCHFTFTITACSLRSYQEPFVLYDGAGGVGLSGGCVVLKDLQIVAMHVMMVGKEIVGVADSVGAGVLWSNLKPFLTKAGVTE